MNPKRSTNQIAMAVFGFGMMAVASPCVVAMIHDVLTQADNIQGALLVGGFMGFVGIAGAILMYLGIRAPTLAPFVVGQELEREILAVARANAGRLTVSELALETSLTLDDAQAALTHFESREVARTHLSDAGDIVYVFPHFDALDKAAAVDPLNDEMVFDSALEDAQDDAEQPLPAEATAEDW